METLLWVWDHLDEMLLVLSAVVAVASGITALTPSPKDDAVVGKIRSVLARLSVLRHGSAKAPLSDGREKPLVSARPSRLDDRE